MKIVMASDEAGVDLKKIIKEHVENLGHEVIDVGPFDKTPVLYPDYAVKACEKIVDKEADRGILICGTGIGMAMTANKVPSIRAAVCHDIYSTERSRKSNDAQVMCMGARVIGAELAKSLVEVWLKCDFSGGGSTAKVEKIKEYEKTLNCRC